MTEKLKENASLLLAQGRPTNKYRKIWGFYPKRREVDISETQFLHAFNLGHLSEEGGG